jgi:hypothetical protein
VTDIAWSHSKLTGGATTTEVLDNKRRVVLQYVPSEALQRTMGSNGLAEDIDVSYNVLAMPSSGSMIFSRAGDVGSRNGNQLYVLDFIVFELFVWRKYYLLTAHTRKHTHTHTHTLLDCHQL